MPAEAADPAITIVPLTSDKGLCGAVNSAVVRDVKKMVAAAPNRSKLQMFSVGERGCSGLTRPFPDLLKFSISQVGTPYNYPTVMAMAVHIANLSAESDKIVVVYNLFRSAISYHTRHMELMPRKRFLESMAFAKLYDQKLPDKNTSNPALYELYLTSNIWVAFLNAAASE